MWLGSLRVLGHRPASFETDTPLLGHRHASFETCGVVFLGVRSCDKRVTWADYWFSSVSRWWIVATTKRAFTCSVPVNVVVSINLDIIYPSSGRTSCSSICRNKNLDPVAAATEREESARERERVSFIST